MSGQRVLVIGIARIGDTLLLTPALRAIKTTQPDAKLTVCAHPKRCSVLANFSAIDCLRGLTKQRARWQGWFSWLKGRSFDVAVVYGRDIALLDYALRVANQVYCFDEPVFRTVQHGRLMKVPLPVGPIHAVAERMLLVDAWLGQDTSRSRRLGMQLTEAEHQAALEWIERADAKGEPLIGLQTCSFPTKAHRDWPASHFLALIQGLLARYPNARILILGDAVAAAKGQLFVDAFPSQVRIAAGKMNLRESAALMQCLDLYVGVDTGPTHMAGALGIPMVAMYHHQYPGRNLMPLDHPCCTVIEHPATGQADSPWAHTGMEAISVEQVLAAACERLTAGRGSCS